MMREQQSSPLLKRGVRRASSFWLALSALCLSADAQGQEQGFSWGPPQASTFSRRIDTLFYVELILAALIAFGVCFLIVFFCVKYRAGTNADRSNSPDRNYKLEAAWIGIPVLLSMGIFVWAARIYFDMYHMPPGATDIYVVGKQWMWKLQHPEGQREINELHVPVGRPIQLILNSQDVIHSFFVPAFRIKQDVVPGRTTSAWFQATKAGKYHLFCAQYCGMNHSRMTGWIYAMEPADYERWLAQSSPGQTMAAEGAKLYRQLGCSGCHGASNTVRAPSLAGIYGRPVPLKTGQIVTADDRYLHDSILLPKSEIAAGYKPTMPSYKGQATEEQVMQLVAYIKSLRDTQGRVDPRQPQNGGSSAQTEAQRQSVKERLQEERAARQGGQNL